MKRKQRGFSLIEVLVVVMLLAIILPAMISSFTASYIMVKETRLLEIAKHVGQTVMERALSDPYPETVADEKGRVFSADWPNFRYNQRFDYDAVTGRTSITVTIRYPFLSQMKEYITVAIRYGS